MADQFSVKFVQTQHDLTKENSNLLLAFETLKEQGFTPLWVTEKVCLQVKQKDKFCAYIFEPFHTAAFNHIVSIGCRVLGSQCVLSCIHLNIEIPRTSKPIYNLAMKDLVISCTNYDKKLREELHNRVLLMGGEVCKEYNDRVTHLVAGEVGSKKYFVAASLNKLIMLPKWVKEVWDKGLHHHLHATDAQFEIHKCPIFKGHVITASGLDAEQRLEVKRAVEANGGKFSGDMKVHECTHLIIKEPKGQKYEFAKKWKILIVSPRWIYKSVEKGYCQEESYFKIGSSALTSTPDKEKSSKANGQLNDIANISSISTVSNMSTVQVDESRFANTWGDNTTMRQMLNSELTVIGNAIDKELDDIDENSRPTELFLDGCKIFISGFRNPQVDKLKKMINAGGGTRLNKIDDNVSHVVMGEQTEKDIKLLQAIHHMPFIVSVTWLIESFKSMKLVPEEKHFVTNLPQCLLSKEQTSKDKRVSNSNFDKMKDSRKSFAKPTAEPSVSVNSRLLDDDQENEEMAAIMSQYLQMEHDVTALAQNNNVKSVANVTVQKVTEQSTAAEDDDETTMEEVGDGHRLFDDKTFVLFGYDEEQQAELTEYITEKGGTVLQWNTRTVPNYALVPIFGFPVESTVEEIATNTWLQMCLEYDKLLDLNSNELFRPFEHITDALPLEGCVLSISGFTGAERDCLLHIAGILGATCQEYLARKASKSLEPNTHLIIKSPEGSKYLAAKKWNLPAVSKKWLLSCVKSGKREPESKYLIDKCLSEPSTPKDQLNAEKTKAKILKHGKSNIEDGSLMSATPKPIAQVKTVVNSEQIVSVESKPQVNLSTPVAMRPKQNMTTPTPIKDRNFSDSQKENMTAYQQWALTGRPQHSRVKELQLDVEPKLPSKVACSELQTGVDSPGKFLDPGREFKPSYDVSEALSALQSPIGQSNSSGSNRRRSSIGLGEYLNTHIKQGVQKAGTAQASAIGTNKDKCGPATAAHPFHGVVIAVSKKLSSKQGEYNNMAASIGADYRWNYDKSCTHFIFQGKTNDINKEFRIARDAGKIIVSPYWLTVCTEQNARVDESLFPHNYNPNMSLSVVKKNTPVRPTRKSTRTGSVTNDNSEASSHTAESQRGFTSEPRKSTIGEAQASTNVMHQVKPDEVKAGFADPAGTLEIREALCKEVDDMMAASKAKKPSRRKSRRLNSSGQLNSSSTPDSRPISRSSDAGNQEDVQRRKIRDFDNAAPEASQSVQVTWDDPTGRLEQEKLAQQLQRAYSPTQDVHSTEMAEYIHNAQFSDEESSDKSIEIYFNNDKIASHKNTGRRTPTPEGPPLAFPVPKSKQVLENIPPCDMQVDEDLVSREDQHGRSSNPVFILSGMQPKERDDYGALVEELGGRMLDGQHYSSDCTHLVVTKPTRNEKFLACVATGKWVLHKSYFEACRRERRFVSEMDHEWGSDATQSLLVGADAQTIKLAKAANRWRLRLKGSKTDSDGAFKGWRLILCTDKNKEDNFRRILEAGSATVLPLKPPFSSNIDATHAFLELNKMPLSSVDLETLLRAGLMCVRTDYTAAYLTDEPTPNIDAFCPKEVLELRESLNIAGDPTKKRKSSSSETNTKRTKMN